MWLAPSYNLESFISELSNYSTLKFVYDNESRIQTDNFSKVGILLYPLNQSSCPNSDIF